MKSKKFMLAGLVLLAITMVLPPLTSCKNDSVPETPEAKQEQAGGTEGNNDSTNTEDNTSGGDDSGTGGEGSGDNPSAGNDGDTGSDETEIGDFGSPFGSGWNNETDLQ